MYHLGGALGFVTHSWILYDLIWFKFKFQEPPVILILVLINFGVKNQVPQVSFKIVVGDSMLVLSHEFVDIRFCDSLDILESISYYGAQSFALHGPRNSLPFYLITCSSPHNTSKDGDILHFPNTRNRFYLTWLYFQGFNIYLFVFISHGSNSQSLFLSH